MTKEEENKVLAIIIDSLGSFDLRDIIEIYKSQTNEIQYPIAGFMLCSCFIDHLSAFTYNQDDQLGDRYKNLAKKYLKKYNSNHLYYDLRCNIVHNYSISKRYALVTYSDQHLKKENGLTVLSLKHFIDDLIIAFENFKRDITKNPVRQNALDWYKAHKIFRMGLV